MSKKKTVLIVTSAVLSLILIIGGVFAFFTDKIDLGDSEITAGTVVLKGTDLQFINVNDTTEDGTDPNYQIWNPGDLSQLDFTIENVGTKSVKAGYIVKLYWDVTDSNNIGTPATRELVKDDGPYPYNNNSITDYKFTDFVKVYTDAAKTTAVTLTYSNNGTADNTADDYWWFDASLGDSSADPYVVLSGSSEKDNTLDAGNKTAIDSTNTTFYVSFDKASGNIFQGVVFKASVEAKAIQHRNTTATDWTNTVTADKFYEAPADVRAVYTAVP